jgi:hypothetical protein
LEFKRLVLSTPGRAMKSLVLALAGQVSDAPRARDKGVDAGLARLACRVDDRDDPFGVRTGP